MRFYYHMYGRHVADLQIYLREAGMESYIWGRYKNQGDAWRYTNVTVFGNNYTVRTITTKLNGERTIVNKNTATNVLRILLDNPSRITCT